MISDATRTRRVARHANGRLGDATLSVLRLVVTSAALWGCSLVNLSGLDDGVATGEDAASPASDASASIQEAAISRDDDAAVDRGDPGANVSDVADAPVAPVESGEAAPDARTNSVDSSVADTGATTGPGGGDAGAPETSVDAGLGKPDGAVTHEAGTWCTTRAPASAVACHDFDEGQPAQAGFTNYYFTGPYVSVTSTDFAPGSSPGCLLVSTPSIAAGAPAQYYQLNDLVTFRDKIELRFAMKLVNYDVSAPEVSLFRIALQDGAWSMSFDFQQAAAILYESVGVPDGGVQHSKYRAAQPSPLDAWTDIDCLIDFSQHTVSLSYNGVAVVSSQLIANPAQDRSAIFVQVGLNFLVGPVHPMLLYYDDVMIGIP